jgi:hypothetical protein
LTNGQSSPSPSNDNLDPTKQQEAYCNLCERSFCNKYFLRTHFAKKHGVLNIISPTSSTTTTELNNNQPLSPPSPPATEQPLPLIVNQKISEDYCEVCCGILFRKKFHFLFCFRFRFVKNVFVINIIFV